MTLLSERLQAVFATLNILSGDMEQKGPANAPSNARSQHSIPTSSPSRRLLNDARRAPKFRSSPSSSSSSSSSSSAPHSAADRPKTPSKEHEYEVVSLPSPTMNIHTVSSLPYNHTEPWRNAADLTTDYQDIDARTLRPNTVEPRPQTPPQQPRPLTEGEMFGRNRSVLPQVAKRAGYWFKGQKSLPLQYGIAQDTPEYTMWAHKAIADIRWIMDHVGEEDEEERKTDRGKVAEFFKRVAQRLHELEEAHDFEGAVSLHDYQVAVARALVDVALPLKTDSFVLFDEIEVLVKQYQEEAERKENKSGKGPSARRAGNWQASACLL